MIHASAHEPPVKEEGALGTRGKSPAYDVDGGLHHGYGEKAEGDEHEGGKGHAFADTHDGSAGYQGSPEGCHGFPEALVGVTVAAPEYGKDGHPHEGYIKGALDMLLRKALKQDTALMILQEQRP